MQSYRHLTLAVSPYKTKKRIIPLFKLHKVLIVLVCIIPANLYAQTDTSTSDTNYVQVGKELQRYKMFSNIGIVAHFTGPVLLTFGALEGQGSFSQLLAASGLVLTVGGTAVSCLSAKITEKLMRNNGFQISDPHVTRDVIISGISFGVGLIPAFIALLYGIDSSEKAKPYVIAMSVCFSIGEIEMAWAAIHSRIFIGKSIRQYKAGPTSR
jgi:hypothetical protein